jgi:hypothetical protein
MIKRYNRFIARLPFCGKFAVKDALYWTAVSVTKGQRIWRGSLTALFLLFYVFCHACQAMMGCYLMLIPVPIVWRVFGGVYLAANALVALNQFLLLFRLLHLMRRKTLSSRNRVSPQPATVALVVAIAFTAAAQIAFLYAEFVFGFSQVSHFPS